MRLARVRDSWNIVSARLTRDVVPVPDDDSMLPTWNQGEDVVVDLDTTLADLEHGDLVTFRRPRSADCADHSAGAGTETMCGEVAVPGPRERGFGRVIGLPGDRLALREGLASVNGVEETDPPYPCTEPARCTFPELISVPRGTVYVLGDHRRAAIDSRFFGPVPLADVTGLVP